MAPTRAGITAATTEWNGLFERIGLELETLAGSVHKLQNVLMPLMADVAARDASAMQHLQDLDLLEQSLHELSDLMAFLDASATLTDAGALSAGVKTIRLAGLAARLSAHPPAAAAASPDLELF